MKLVVISGPSGVGKSTVVAAVLQAFPDLTLGVSLTTRPQRPGDRPGRYVYVDRAEFQRRLQAGELLEHAEYNGELYGSLRPLGDGAVLLEIEVKGAAQVKHLHPDALLIFMVTPGSTIAEQLEVLGQRLRQRSTDDPAAIAGRLAQAEAELRQGHSQSDVVIVNQDLETATQQTARAIHDYLHKI